MKTAFTFTLGLLTSLGLFTAFKFWRTPETSTASPSSAALLSVLREIREAREIATSLDFMTIHMPSLLFGHPSPAVRELLQLDDREVKNLANMRSNFGDKLQQATDAHLRGHVAKDGVVTAELRAFPGERAHLLNEWRTEALTILDDKSAALLASIDLNSAMQACFQGTLDYSVTFIPIQNSQSFSIVFKRSTANGSERAEMILQRTELFEAYPSLAAYLPALPTR